MCMHRASGSSLGMRIVANRCSLLGFPALTVSPVAAEVALEQISHPRSSSKGAHAFALKTWGQTTEVWKLRGPLGPLWSISLCFSQGSKLPYLKFGRVLEEEDEAQAKRLRVLRIVVRIKGYSKGWIQGPEFLLNGFGVSFGVYLG